MSQFLMSLRRQNTNCLKCHGEGFIRGKKCPECNGLGQVNLRPAKNGKIVVIGIILVLFILFCLSKLFVKQADAADSPVFPTIVETTQPHIDEVEIQVPPCHVTPSYPEGIMQWCTLITQEAHQNDISSNLIAAVILQESGGQVDIISDSGAVGLMQVMPRDGIAASFECINGPCFASRPTIEELLDPNYNVAYGANLLADLINRENGSIREALKAYGPMDMGYSYADKVLSIMENYK